MTGKGDGMFQKFLSIQKRNTILKPEGLLTAALRTLGGVLLLGGVFLFSPGAPAQEMLSRSLEDLGFPGSPG